MAQATDPTRPTGAAGEHRAIAAIRAEIGRVIVGQTELVDRLLQRLAH